jgi:hypothetical protein
MAQLLEQARLLAADLQALKLPPDDVEAGLLAALGPFIRTLEAEGIPQHPSTEALSRFCIENMDWSSPLFLRCQALIGQAQAQLKESLT